MKKLLVICTCVAALAAGSVFASEGGKGRNGGDREARIERMKAHLELSDEQVAEMRAIKKSGGGREEIRAVLTQDQQQKWDEAREKHREQKQQRDSGQQTSTL